MKHLHLTCIVAVLLGSRCMAQSQVEPIKSKTDLRSAVEQLRSQLRWSDESSHEQYLANRGQVTNQIWTLIDSFVTNAYRVRNISPEQLKSTLDSVLGHKSGDLENTIIFPVDIPAGRYVLVGLEVTRGGGAVAENAISFRAYGRVQSRWTLVSHVELEPEPDNEFLLELNALALPQGFPGKFGFIAWATEPPLSPFKVVARVYAFDGQQLTPVWAPQAFVTGHVPSFVTLTSSGFDLHTLTEDRTTRILQSYQVVSGEVIKHSDLELGPRN